MVGTFPFPPNHRARIKRGQFEGYEVTVVAADEAEGAVQLSMMVFGRSVPLTFTFADAIDVLEPLPGDPAG